MNTRTAPFIFLILLIAAAAAPAQTENRAVMIRGNQRVLDTKTFDSLVISSTGSLVSGSGSTIRIGDIEIQWQGVPATVSVDAWGVRHGLVVNTSGAQGAAIIGKSSSGASAGWFIQDTHFDSPSLQVIRTGSYGEPSSSPVLSVLGSVETSGTSQLAKFGGCLALSGDNYIIMWGDSSMSVPGGILDNSKSIQGKTAVDPVHRQLVAEDGLTPVLTWTGTAVKIRGLTDAPSPPQEGMIYFNTQNKHFYGHTGSAWKQLDN